MSRWTGLTLCVVGYGRGSGKTRVVEELTKILVSRGYSVATVKHCLHPIDVTDKDTYRHRAAGARATLAISRGEVALFLTDSKDSLEGYFDLLPSTTFTLIEGFRRLNYPKILCIADEAHLSDIGFDMGSLVAVVICRDSVKISGIDKPVFCLNDLNSLADILVDMALARIKRMLGGSDCGRCGFKDCRSFASAMLKGEVNPYLCILSRGSRIEIFFDGKPIQLNIFTEKIVFSTLKGLLSCFKGLEKLDDANVKFRLEISSF
ncbi:MAG: molybdopterin-guanine dinucleotide biosynthesis protein B [Nitrososphaerota archaeon]|nr:molybdopterin-guanine dinucleotide biosynthesis protein B [Candidatus Bathyarchaeota archaeon]MCX8162631.1 molybdopterin-guanine dinucleotide biosynthesis protein B [Candidatus Bathyarchaeota archaeon]MDW8061715.1 molybdopterin-guanine dinucleotide biosynthesis protein B [Nitrososphaerota archaeon]